VPVAKPWSEEPKVVSVEDAPLADNYCIRSGDSQIPQVTIKTGLTTPDGREELLTEYLCDHPGCPNIANEMLGCIRELRLVAAVCKEHAPRESA
jgi:hypothetical protein